MSPFISFFLPVMIEYLQHERFIAVLYKKSASMIESARKNARYGSSGRSDAGARRLLRAAFRPKRRILRWRARGSDWAERWGAAPWAFFIAFKSAPSIGALNAAKICAALCESA
ncbi:MAG: hypothetical protein MR399_09195 [Clostridiales bacterium]|nr:hypothetical protein [Clostridiales bacterium]MDY2870941.1 hypothetical protein [Eubacteriales bacterium]